jgi:hypothetical protein
VAVVSVLVVEVPLVLVVEERRMRTVQQTPVVALVVVLRLVMVALVS